ncbi:MAG: DUF1802 family protein [Akkermansiaceae bacterium]
METAIGFKEWMVICDALADGRQTVILRKGGIHEGREGFSFAHERFFLFPTRFHATAEQVRVATPLEPLPEWQVGDVVSITHRVEVEWAHTLTDWQDVMALQNQHIYTEQTVRDRFEWQGRGMASGSIHVAKVKVFELSQPWVFPYEPRYGGCRSWVTLDQPPEGI